MRRKVFIGLIFAIVLLVFAAVFFIKKYPVDLSVFGIKSSVRIPSYQILNQRGISYPIGITDQAGYTEFSGTVVSVDDSQNGASITINTSDNNNVLKIKLLFPPKATKTLLYKIEGGKMAYSQIWNIVTIESVLKETLPNSQILIYIKKSKHDLYPEISKNDGKMVELGPIEKLAIYAK